ncbi:hypothetical protein NNJEOMEG_01806 [Fundidesulfovibrio magnetotacticus]|uniref:YcfA-like protein n=1 Tax=Fundidesulfovibrio magnetotacticus TaxID=2730080 RepID=A0A6V8LUG9_9BACT|nr:hypothetical protein [Fundidesulfovibrio magnetotacticus]GFK93968.1 hypothetical protein NNJEOMEG_01806 [Fundidesulfovibrio magnetotacticus]
MGSTKKNLARMRRNLQDWRIEDLQAIARAEGIEWRHKGTSHCIFVRRDGATLPVPAKRPIKPVYIKLFLEFLGE